MGWNEDAYHAFSEAGKERKESGVEFELRQIRFGLENANRHTKGNLLKGENNNVEIQAYINTALHGCDELEKKLKGE